MPSVAPAKSQDGTQEAADVYRVLMGCGPAEVRCDDDWAFDRHVFASLLAVAAEGRDLPDQLGLPAGELAALLRHWFPHATGLASCLRSTGATADDEVDMLRGLLLAHRSTEGNDGRWLAAMVARRAVEPNHLWEDLGLRDRSELSRLLSRHFTPLARRNTRNMRWKRFFYRTLCEADGLVLCSTPVCSACADFELCFGEESGESRLANARRGQIPALAAP